MDQIQRNANAFSKLLDIEYYYCISIGGHGREIRLRFNKEDFAHLEGIGQLKDLQIHFLSGETIFDMAVNGKITEADLRKSAFYQSAMTENKVNTLHLLETALDHNDLVFRYVQDPNGRIRIEAKILLYTDVAGNQIYVYLDQKEGRYTDFFCRSFVANPGFDRTRGLKKITLLWKEKNNLKSHSSDIQYQRGDFEPSMLLN